MSTGCCMETNLTMNFILKNKFNKRKKKKEKEAYGMSRENCWDLIPGTQRKRAATEVCLRSQPREER